MTVTVIAELKHRDAELKHCALVFRGATGVDCTGAPRCTADVAIDEDRIAAVV
ncbi:hypothetical protein ACFTXM_41385 [Streptomyces sp. NPDC056930]|uniref:hypothetical protein n=1 Tax=Streptomyces sp. NPDC056930 TaxID=3345967 RepID=UPI003639953A